MPKEDAWILPYPGCSKSFGEEILYYHNGTMLLFHLGKVKILPWKVLQTLWTTSAAAVGVKPGGNLAYLFGHFCINTFTSKQY